MRGPNKAAMPPMSWNQLEKDAGAVQKNATTGRSGRKGNGTRSTFSTNGEFNGSAKPTSSELQQLAGGTINPKRSQPRALFVSKDGSPVLTWNEIEQINMNDLNNALGSFNPGQQTRGKANGKKQKQFYGGKRGNGKVGRQEATTSLLSYKSNTGTEQQSPLQAKRPLKKVEGNKLAHRNRKHQQKDQEDVSNLQSNGVLNNAEIVRVEKMWKRKYMTHILYTCHSQCEVSFL